MTFQEWWDSGATDVVGEGGIRACVERAWNAALDAAAASCERKADAAKEEAEECAEGEDDSGVEQCEAAEHALCGAAEDIGLLKVDSEWTRPAHEEEIIF